MIDIETHRIIDMIKSRQEEDITEWLKTYPNLEVISRDGGIVYKSSSEKAHPKAEQVSDRFHILKNLAEYATTALKRMLKNKVKINDKIVETKSSNPKKKYEYKTKWELILKVKELRKQQYRVIDISQSLGISEKTVIEYNKIPMEDKEKYNQIPIEELKSQVNQENKWELIQQVQEEYKKVKKYSVVARKYGLDARTVKKYISIKEAPINGNKDREYSSKLDLYKNTIIDSNNKGYSLKVIKDIIKKDGYMGSDSLLRRYLAKIKKERIEVTQIEHTVERTTLISLLYKEIEHVKNITNEMFTQVIKIFPEVGKIYATVTEFKEIMFSKKENKLDEWINKTRKLNIPEITSFINGIERDIVAVKNGIKYDYNNGLAEGSVNKIKVIKRIMYGRCSFDLLKQKVLLQY